MYHRQHGAKGQWISETSTMTASTSHDNVSGISDKTTSAEASEHIDNRKATSRTITIIDFIFITVLLLATGAWALQNYLNTPPYVSKEKYPIRGIDISSHNGMINFEAVADDGIEFAFIKASEGGSIRDDNFRLNHSKATKAGLKVGAYHFFRFDVEGVTQALNFLNAVKDMPLDLGLAVDVEQPGNPKDVPTDSIAERLDAMLGFLNLKGYRVTLYTNRNGYYDYIDDDFRGLPLWICSFSDPPISADWSYWQFNHRGRVKGIRGDVDLNAFNGSRNDWYDYLSGHYTD